MLIDPTQLHFQGTAVNFVIFKCFSVCFKHGTPNYRKIPYPENVKSKASCTKLSIPAHLSNCPAVALLVIT
jgi:hypothetical protein